MASFLGMRQGDRTDKLPLLGLAIGSNGDRTPYAKTLHAVLLPYNTNGQFNTQSEKDVFKKDVQRLNDVLWNKFPFLKAAKMLKNAFKYGKSYVHVIHHMATWKNSGRFAQTHIFPYATLQDIIYQTVNECKKRFKLNFQDPNGLDSEYLNELFSFMTTYGYYLRLDLRDKRVVVIGDTHGSLHSLVEILEDLDKKKKIFQPQDKNLIADDVHVVVLGDIMDRSPYALECMWLFLRLYTLNPQKVTLLGGNHEMDAEYQWRRSNGSMNEIEGEYAPRNQSEQLHRQIASMFTHFPHSLIADTDIGLVQFNHGGVELNAKDKDIIDAFRKFCGQHPTHNDVDFGSLVMVREANPLVWADVGSRRHLRPDPWHREIIFADELEEYLDAFQIQLLIRGHSDLANLSLLYSDDGDDTSSLSSFRTVNGTFQIGEEDNPYPMHTFVPDESAQESRIQVPFRVGPKKDDGGRGGSSGSSGNKNSSHRLLAVTTSTAVFSKPNRKFQSMSSYLILE